MENPLLECRDVSFGYGTRTVLRGINQQIDRGDFIGVIGPNGAGKSTLTKILSGLLRPSDGTVILNGSNIRSFSKKEIAEQLAVVQQEEAPDFSFTVAEEVMIGRAPHHGGLYFEGSADLAIVMDVMEKTRIAHLAERKIETLSGGERQRVRIARALAQQPEMLLLDEPTNHLDLYAQLSLMELMREINGEGIAIFVVSHDINFMCESCSHLKILYEGEFYCQGSPREVITEENLAYSFNIQALVDVNPITSAPRMTPLARLDDKIKV